MRSWTQTFHRCAHNKHRLTPLEVSDTSENLRQEAGLERTGNTKGKKVGKRRSGYICKIV